MPRTMYSLFVAMTGERWPGVIRNVMHEESGGAVIFAFIFIVFIFFTVVMLMNLVTGVIVETVLLISRASEIDELKQVRQHRIFLRDTLQEMFREADTDNSNS